jgi:CRP-like cAMP-binding protein
MPQSTLRFLTEDDQRLLLEKATRLSYHREEEIISEESHQQALFFLRSGQVRVELAGIGGTREVATLGPGEIFGEMGFVEHSGASASVIAEGDVEVDVVDGCYVQALLFSVPGFAARFFHSLAVTLSQRLRETSGSSGE